MNKKKNPFLFWFWLTVIILSIIGLVRHFHIKNFQVIAPGVLYTSGQPQGLDYTRLLYKYHIATFVNLRYPDEHREHNWYNEEITWMRDKSVNYIELPMEKNVSTDDIPDMNNYQKFLEIMNQRTNLPVLLHDSNGKKRVPYLAAIWMLKSGGFTYEQTVEKIKKINDRPLNEEETNFLKSLSAGVK
ncbi:MAG: tyrosine-protein phosphatase [Phycisphaerae bacterium]|nr:tyrosine-protein phosphatase [Phycisphaerae bacterium]